MARLILHWSCATAHVILQWRLSYSHIDLDEQRRSARLEPKMIIYCTSTTRKFDDVLSYAKETVRKMGTGTARLAVPEPHLNPQEQLQAAEDIIADNERQAGIVVVASMYELPILRFSRRVRENAIKAEQVVVYCLTSSEDLGSKVHSLRIDSEGEFLDKWPEGFYEERMVELF